MAAYVTAVQNILDKESNNLKQEVKIQIKAVVDVLHIWVKHL